jgi:Tfp pilus assembly protein PilE
MAILILLVLIPLSYIAYRKHVELKRRKEIELAMQELEKCKEQLRK